MFLVLRAKVSFPKQNILFFSNNTWKYRIWIDAFIRSVENSKIISYNSDSHCLIGWKRFQVLWLFLRGFLWKPLHRLKRDFQPWTFLKPIIGTKMRNFAGPINIMNVAYFIVCYRSQNSLCLLVEQQTWFYNNHCVRLRPVPNNLHVAKRDMTRHVTGDLTRHVTFTFTF